MSPEVVNHVHIGGGKLGLGLVGELTQQAEIATTFLTRAESGGSPIHRTLLEAKVYDIKSGGCNPRSISAHKWVPYDSADLASETSKEAIEALASADSVSTAVGRANFNSVTPILIEGIKRKLEIEGGTYHARETCLIAFENVQDNSTILRDEILQSAKEPKISRFVTEKLIPYPVVVDRICSEVFLDEKTGRVTCSAEDYYEVTISRAAGAGLLPFVNALSGLSGVTVVGPGEFPLYEKRKYWLVNGIHVALATLAMQKGVYLTDEAMRDPEIHGTLARIQMEFATALAEYARSRPTPPKGFDLISLCGYNVKVAERFGGHEDHAHRVFSEAQVFEELKRQCPQFASEFSEYNRKLLNEIDKNRPSWIDEYGRQFVDALDNAMWSVLSPITINSIFGKLTARICEPIEILLQHQKSYPKDSVAFLLGLMAILSDPKAVWV